MARFSPVAASALALMLASVVAACGSQAPAPRSTSTTVPPTSTTVPHASTTVPNTSTAASTTSAASTGPSTTTTTTTTPNGAGGCRLSPRHPDPVILVPGTYGATSWQLIDPQLTALGYCVYPFTYGDDETGDIVTSAHELGRFVSSLLAATHAARVAIVGHSEGGMMPRYYIRFLGGADKVSKLVGLAPSNAGTLNPATLGGALTGCIACAQQQTGSAFLTKLNAGDEAPPPVDYTVIETVYDTVVIPYTSAFLTAPAARVTNITLQQQCPEDFANHLSITTDPVALQWVEQALEADGPADPQFVPTC
jgi:triacylglycerol lipase